MADEPNTPSAWDETKEDLLPYLRRLIVTIVVIGLALLLWELKEVVLLAFAAVLVAVALLAVTRAIQRITKLGHRWALLLAGLTILLVLGLISWMAWPSFQEQLTNLVTRLTESLDQLEEILGISLPDAPQEIAQAIAGAVDQIFSSVVSVAGALVNVAVTLIVVIFSGVFLAVDPALYRRGLVLLFPRGWHEKVGRALDETGRGLRLWLQAQILAMIAVGLLVGVGAAIIGLPSPAALGLIAGLTEFVPIIGPFVGAIPALLVAVGVDGTTVLWTVILYVAVQQVEANLITPVLQRRIVSIPPVVLLLSFVALGIVFGVAGIIVAAPLSIALFILVREFYVGDLLAERDQLSEWPRRTESKRSRRRRRHREAEKSEGEAPAK